MRSGIFVYSVHCKMHFYLYKAGEITGIRKDVAIAQRKTSSKQKFLILLKAILARIHKLGNFISQAKVAMQNNPRMQVHQPK